MGVNHNMPRWGALAFLGLLALAPSSLGQDRGKQEVLDERARQRAQILATAEQYVTHEWSATEENVFHGKTPNGIPVATPDVSFDQDGWKPDGTVNVGIPYAWGGFSSLEQFDEGVAAGMYAGNVPVSTGVPGTHLSVGVDCSGFVARCWALPVKQSTRTLGSLCDRLDSYDELLPGDILNKANGHVVLFKEWVGADRTQLLVVEAARLRVKESVYERDWSEREGFLPMRYKALGDRWVAMEDGAPSFAVPDSSAEGRWIPHEGAEEPDLSDLENPFADAVPLEWAGYQMDDSFPGLPPRSITRRLVARVEEDDVDLQLASEFSGQVMKRGETLDRTDDFEEARLGFAAFEEPLSYMTAETSSVQTGIYELGGRRFEAKKIEATMEGYWVMHSRNFPVTVDIVCYQSDEVPLQGILEVDFDFEITWEENGDDKTVSKRKMHLSLLEFGGPVPGKR